MERYRALDFFKGVAIIFVVIAHCNWTYEQRMKFGFPFWIDMAVPIFMIISGYVYAKSYERRHIETIEEAWAPNNTLDKFIRYTVPYVISYIIEILMRILNGSWNGIKHSLLIFLEGGDGPGSYYYPIMIQFIFLFPILYFPIKKDIYRGTMFCLILNIIYELIFQRVYDMTETYYRMIVFRYIFLIAMGIVLTKYSGKLNLKKWLLFVTTMIIGITYIIVYRYQGKQLQVFRYWIGTSMLPALFIVSIVFMGVNIYKKMHFKPLEIVGRASYDIFLTQMVYFLFAEYIYRLFDCNDILSQVIVSLLITIIVGIMFYYFENGITSKFKMYIMNKLKSD